MESLIDRVAVHLYIEDFMSCEKKETCQDCTCQKDGDYFICALLSHYRDKVIEKIHEIT